MNIEDIYLMADTHLGHSNVLKAEYDGRPFDTIEEHDHALTQNTINTVPKGKTLIILGDVAWPKVEPAIPFLNALRDNHINVQLIKGNHDDKLIKKLSHYFSRIDDVRYFKAAGHAFFLSHYAHRTWRGSNSGSYHIHGHSHGQLPILGRSMDAYVGDQEWGPMPLSWYVNMLRNNPTTNHHS